LHSAKRVKTRRRDAGATRKLRPMVREIVCCSNDQN
jgi:hypothetical protein